MLPWIIQMSIISLILIILLHYLFTFFKTNLTIPKVKDLVNKPQKQYEKLFDTMNQNNIKQNPIKSNESDNMKNELKNYLNDLRDRKNSPESKPKPNSDVNQMDGLMTADNMGSSAYSSF
jgi:type II secretory pathway component PulC|uniref:Uncharacterized protein n=1 Tax=viral metagenome TaxID=1070528 RepID=A0A6C0CLB7_9ZZZZ